MSIPTQHNPLDGMQVHDVDESGGTGYYYYGYIGENGSGLIMRAKTDGTEYLFCLTKTTNYTSDWTNRATKTYQRLDQI